MAQTQLVPRHTRAYCGGFGAPGPLGALGAPGPFGAPGPLGAAPGPFGAAEAGADPPWVASLDASAGSSAPHFLQLVISGGLNEPHSGHFFIMSSKDGGLKHIDFLLYVDPWH